MLKTWEVTCPSSSQDTPSQMQQSSLAFQDCREMLLPTKVRLFLNWSSKDFWSSRHYPETTSKWLQRHNQYNGITTRVETKLNFHPRWFVCVTTVITSLIILFKYWNKNDSSRNVKLKTHDFYGKVFTQSWLLSPHWHSAAAGGMSKFHFWRI